MECMECGIRSAVGSCKTCGKLLCEECGIECQECGHVVCSEHVNVTPGKRNLCEVCFEKRQERREGHKSGHAKAKTGGGVIEELDGEELEEGETLEERTLTASARRAPNPSVISLAVAGLGLALMLLVLFVPDLRRVGLGPDAYLPTPLILLIIPLVGAAWGIFGMKAQSDGRTPYRTIWRRSMAGVGIAIVSCVIGVFAWQTDPARIADQEARQNQQQEMTPEELEQWRQQRLERYLPTEEE
ncbi:MAG: hypothetical protein ACLFU6_03195 [Candidatus Hydrogenedentota bacterium]